MINIYSSRFARRKENHNLRLVGTDVGGSRGEKVGKKKRGGGKNGRLGHANITSSVCRYLGFLCGQTPLDPQADRGRTATKRAKGRMAVWIAV